MNLIVKRLQICYLEDMFSYCSLWLAYPWHALKFFRNTTVRNRELRMINSTWKFTPLLHLNK